MVVCVAYVGVSSVLTLMLPYYLQNAEAPLPFVFNEVGLMAAGWVVAIGALFGLSTSLLGRYIGTVGSTLPGTGIYSLKHMGKHESAENYFVLDPDSPFKSKICV